MVNCVKSQIEWLYNIVEISLFVELKARAMCFE